jgi:arsenical pump membrane protein
VSADFFKYSFVDHLVFMGPVAVATIASSLLLVYVFFRKKIPKVYDVTLVDILANGTQPIAPRLLKVSIATLIAIDVGYVLASWSRVPVSLVICSGALFLLVVYWMSLHSTVPFNGERKGLKTLAREINWDIVLFMLSIFLVVQGLKHAGVIEFFASILASTSLLPSVLGVLVPSLVVTIGASFMNNWPMTILGLLSIKQTIATASLSGQTLTGLVFSNVIGNNLGPHFFPLGSLAILMWLETMRRKGVKISLKDYLKVGAVLSIAEVAIASAVLWAELSFFGFRLGL